MPPLPFAIFLCLTNAVDKENKIEEQGRDVPAN
jgi:hypothetical protein